MKEDAVGATAGRNSVLLPASRIKMRILIHSLSKGSLDPFRDPSVRSTSGMHSEEQEERFAPDSHSKAVHGTVFIMTMFFFELSLLRRMKKKKKERTNEKL